MKANVQEMPAKQGLNAFCLNDRIVVKMMEKAEFKTPGGMIVPETAQICDLATVMAVGKDELELTEGDTVLMSQFGGSVFTFGVEKYHIFHRKQVYLNFGNRVPEPRNYEAISKVRQ